MVDGGDQKVVATEGDHVEGIVPSLDCLKEGGEGVPRRVGEEAERVVGVRGGEGAVLQQHVVHRPRHGGGGPHHAAHWVVLLHLPGTACWLPDIKPIVKMNHMNMNNTSLGSPGHVGSALSRRLHIEPASEVALQSDGLGLVEVLAAALAAAAAGARARVEVAGLQLEAVLVHPEQTPPLPRLPRVDIRLQFGGWVTDLTRAATSDSQQNSSISNHTHQNLLVNFTERIHVFAFFPFKLVQKTFFQLKDLATFFQNFHSRSGIPEKFYIEKYLSLKWEYKMFSNQHFKLILPWCG